MKLLLLVIEKSVIVVTVVYQKNNLTFWEINLLQNVQWEDCIHSNICMFNMKLQTAAG